MTLRRIVVVASVPVLTAAALAGIHQQSGAVRPAGSPSATVEPQASGSQSGVPYLRFDLPTPQATIQGQPIEFPAHELWRPMCSGAVPSQQEFLESVLAHKALSANGGIVVDESHGDAGLNLVYVLSGSIPPGATAAVAAAEAYIQSFFSDPIIVTINCSFQPLSPGVLGSTASSYGYVSYSTARSQMVSDKDASDTIQSWLPSGTTCPVRYTSGSTVTNETRVYFTYADWKAVDGTVSGTDANMTFNSNFAFDYDPSNGVGGSSYSFQDILIHESGHALGFTSGVDFRFYDMETLDLFRFQRTDGSGDYNPDTTAEFQVRARLVAFNAPNDDHNSDLISAEYRMSDGSPYQASHFREQTANIGLMDPALAPGETWWPAFFSTADVAMFDAVGYDY